MKELATIVYVTDDGKTFTDKKLAEDHEKVLSKTKVFELYQGADLTEGKHGAQFKGFIVVIADYNHSLLAEDYCYRTYGNRAGFVQGYESAGNCLEMWKLKEVSKDKYDKSKVVHTINL